MICGQNIEGTITNCHTRNCLLVGGNCTGGIAGSNEWGGTASASPKAGATGTPITLTATPSEGYAFKEWQVIKGGVTVTDNKFQIGAENVEIKAIFEAIPVEPDPEPETYTLTFDANGGAGMSFADGMSVMLTGDTTIYAQWKANDNPKPDPDPQPDPKPETNPLMIIRHPADQIVSPGETAEFTVLATGDGLSYQWYINRNDGRGWVKLQGAVSAS